MSACSFRTFLLASMSHLFPSRRRSTPAEAFWEQQGKASQGAPCPPSRCPRSSGFSPHLFDALHPVLDVLKGFLICDVVHEDNALRDGTVHQGALDHVPLRASHCPLRDLQVLSTSPTAGPRGAPCSPHCARPRFPHCQPLPLCPHKPKVYWLVPSALCRPTLRTMAPR